MKKCAFLLTICILIVTGCDYGIVSYYPEKGKGNEASEKGEETVETDKGSTPDRSDSLFVLVENEENRYVFETSNNKYLSEEGYTLWSVKNTKQVSSWRVSVSKEAGNSKAGYGILFCGESKDGSDTFYTFLINNEGQYTTGRVLDGKYTTLTSWKSLKALRHGYGISNTLGVSYDEDTHQLSLSINEESAGYRSLPDKVEYFGSYSGFVAVVSNQENFPGTPVHISYKDI